MLIDIPQEEFDRRVVENYNTFLAQKQQGSFDITKYHLATHEMGELSIPILIANIHDIYASIIVGALASPHRNGCDAIIMDKGKVKQVELKTSYISRSSIWKSPRGTIYTGTENSRNKMKPIESYLKAEYKIYKKDLESKYIDTYLICMDGSNGDLICVYKIVQDKIKEAITYKNGIIHHGDMYRKSVSLSQFKKVGSLVNTKIPQVGIDEWKKRIHNDIPTLKSGERLNGN